MFPEGPYIKCIMYCTFSLSSINSQFPVCWKSTNLIGSVVLLLLIDNGSMLLLLKSKIVLNFRFTNTQNRVVALILYNVYTVHLHEHLRLLTLSMSD